MLVRTCDDREQQTNQAPETLVMLVPQTQAFQGIQPMHAFVVHRPAFTPKHHVQSSITEPAALLGERLQPCTWGCPLRSGSLR